MKESRKTLFKWVAAMAMVAMLAACSTKAPAPSTNTPTNSVGDSDPIRLTVWAQPSLDWPTNTDKKNQDLYEYIQGEMEKKFPGIIIDYVGKGWGDDLRQNLMLAVMAGNPPDVSFGEDFVPELAKLGALSEVPADFTTDLADGPMEAAKFEDKIYAVSGMTGIFALMYNKDVMTKAGLNPDAPPQTWDEWLDMSKKITEAGKGEYFGSVVQTTGLGGTFRIAPFMRQLGGDLTSPDSEKITFQSPENVKALSFLKELSLTAPSGSTALNDENALYNLVHHGKAAFGVAGPWHISWSQNEKCNCGFAPLPVPEDGERANVIVGNTLWFVLKQSKNQEAGMEYLRIIASKEYQEKFAIASGRMPSNKLAIANTELVELVPELAVYGEIVANEQAGPLPSYPKNGPKIWEAWHKAQESVLIGDKSIEESLAEAQKTAEDLLK
ncbi:extracellular solute-binding protein [Paenibacillus sp. PAMC21692]|uniref:sugar ABC transporter substrate-binding protein n=1 Tax=Paenibacillus sp. PAMC21692 TaxID=2762320 RepID=UPI00164E7CA5|nr:extracellular solute-binding protein [Paenibacillus sp. PAMC21692]QNK54961.1 extracellular solute-binding protein [Paenibacillus sp. PAMC21692]